MKDKEQNFRGGCRSCSCTEYAFIESSNKCEECKCSVTQHDLVKNGEEMLVYRNAEAGANFVIYFAAANFGVWILMVGALVYMKQTGMATNNSVMGDRGIGDLSYWCGAAACGFVMQFMAVGFFTAKTPERKAITGVYFFLLAIYFLTYILFITRATPTWIGNKGSITDPLRYIEWLL
ncbi:hypothetical protein HK096_001175, partial [Nowakowskiella sp. JEL0078]